jgi:hypothetical protein
MAKVPYSPAGKEIQKRAVMDIPEPRALALDKDQRRLGVGGHYVIFICLKNLFLFHLPTSKTLTINPQF